jgi:hypothetical protein
MYVKRIDAGHVDNFLKEKGYTSRKQYLDTCIERTLKSWGLIEP